MKNDTAMSSRNEGRKRIPSAPAVSKKGAVTITCGYCKNTFVAVPRDAVCLKCKRPANRPLSALDMLLSLLIFPYGLLKSVLIRPSYPYAARQALLISLVGAAVWAAVYFLILK